MTGKVCYEGDNVPLMTAYFEHQQSRELHTVSLLEESYEITLPPGTYTAYVWTQTLEEGGSYSEAVACGLGEGCTDHTLRPFEVLLGQTTEGIDLCDWSGEAGSIPLPQSNVPQGEVAVPPPFMDSVYGRVRLDVCFPGEQSIPMTVYLQSAADPLYVIQVGGVGPGGEKYISEMDLEPGQYYAYAWLPGFLQAGAYTEAVACGMGESCTDHSLRPFEVVGGQTTEGITICDWSEELTGIAKPWFELSAEDFDPEGMGTVTGKICFPLEERPPMKLYFQNSIISKVTGLAIDEMQSSYSMELPEGIYIAYGWLHDFSWGGLYSQAVACGMGEECRSNYARRFEVVAGQTTENIDVCDWSWGKGMPHRPGMVDPSNPYP